jgi:hypothetical protein
MNHSSFIQTSWIGNKILANLLTACNVTTYYNTTTEETIEVPFVFGDGVPTLGAPVTDIDRYIGSDDIDSYITLNTISSPPCMHLPEWKISFNTNLVTNAIFQKLYGETTGGSEQYSIGNGAVDSKKLRFFAKSGGATILGVDSVVDVFDGTSKFVELERTLSGDVTLTVDGVYELLGAGLSGTYIEATDVMIGGMFTTSLLNSTFDRMWDFTKCGQLIPLDEGVGTDIKDSLGVSVGVLTDPSSTFWDYYLPRSIVPATGNIYHPTTEELIGVRDPATGIFTPVGDWVLQSDDACVDNLLITKINIAVVKDGEFQFRGVL